MNTAASEDAQDAEEDILTARDEWFRRLYAGAEFGVEGDPRTATDDREALLRGASLLFGEVMPSGVDKMLDSEHLDAARPGTVTLVDLGAGLGRLALQAFLEFPNLSRVVAVELAASRFQLGADALRRLARHHPDRFSIVRNIAGKEIILVDRSEKTTTTTTPLRVLRFVRGDLFEMGAESRAAQIVVVETRIPDARHRELTRLLSTFQTGTRIMLYHPLRTLPGVLHPTGQSRRDNAFTKDGAVFRRLAHGNSSISASWTQKSLPTLSKTLDVDGHVFDFWEVLTPLPNSDTDVDADARKNTDAKIGKQPIEEEVVVGFKKRKHSPMARVQRAAMPTRSSTRSTAVVHRAIAILQSASNKRFKE